MRDLNPRLPACFDAGLGKKAGTLAAELIARSRQLQLTYYRSFWIYLKRKLLQVTILQESRMADRPKMHDEV